MRLIETLSCPLSNPFSARVASLAPLIAVDMEEQIANLVPPQLMEEKEAHNDILRKEMSQMRAHHRETQVRMCKNMSSVL